MELFKCLKGMFSKKKDTSVETFRKVTEIRKSQIEEGFSPCYSNWWLRVTDNPHDFIEKEWCAECQHKSSCNTWV
jgi:hypothetical protein